MNTYKLNDTPSDSVDVVAFELSGFEFLAISAGPLFKINPSVSFMVPCKKKEEVDELWNKLSKGGQALMELGAYPFSERYGWVQDRYGLSWQIMFSGGAVGKQRIIPVTLFVGEVCGRAEEAMRFWTSVFPEGNIKAIDYYGKNEGPDKEDNVMHADFSLSGLEFGAMDSALNHQFQFNEAISFIVNCATQEEIDYYWEKLSADPEAEQCGWLKDKFGFSWQIVPSGLEEMLQGDDRERINRVTQAFLVMKKLDIATLQEAYDGK